MNCENCGHIVNRNPSTTTDRIVHNNPFVCIELLKSDIRALDVEMYRKDQEIHRLTRPSR